MKFYFYWFFPLCYLRLSAAFYINLSSALYFQIYIPRYWHDTALCHCCLLILLSLDSLILTLAIFVGIYEWWGRRVVCDALKTSTCFKKLHSCNKPLSKGMAVNFGYHLSLKEMSHRKNIWIQYLNFSTYVNLDRPTDCRKDYTIKSSIAATAQQTTGNPANAILSRTSKTETFDLKNLLCMGFRQKAYESEDLKRSIDALLVKFWIIILVGDSELTLKRLGRLQGKIPHHLLI